MENNEAYLSFLGVWGDIMFYLFLGSIGLAVLLFILYQIRYFTAPGLREKFEIASEHEIATYLRANYILAAGIFFIANTAKGDVVQLSPIWFGIRIFISLCIATLHSYVSYLIFKYYYPGPLNKKLKRLRFTPRINPATGNTMKLLSEDEEDAYLDEGMQAEEDAFSVNYDVWIDEQTGETRIEKYKGHLSALECDRCGFETLKLQKEEVIQAPTDYEDGILEKEYKCSYCGRVRRITKNLTKNMDKEAANLAHNHSPDQRISLIKVEIHDNEGETVIYEFQNRDQAKKFLEEFNFSKLAK